VNVAEHAIWLALLPWRWLITGRRGCTTMVEHKRSVTIRSLDDVTGRVSRENPPHEKAAARRYIATHVPVEAAPELLVALGLEEREVP
jgi:hypothetical protein